MSREELEKKECPKCFKGNMEVRRGRFGMFLGCSRYPKCKCTLKLEGETHTDAVMGECPLCGHELRIRVGKYGPFIACISYPTCTHTAKIMKPIGLKCPLGCGGDVVYLANKQRPRRRSKGFYGCSNYPECQFGSWGRPTDRKCPECGFFTMELWEYGKLVGYVCGTYNEGGRLGSDSKLVKEHLKTHERCSWREDLPEVEG